MTSAAELGLYLERELRRAAARSRGRERYLLHLFTLEQERGRHVSKRANWLKFCHDCGLEISGYPRYIRQCFYCAAELHGVAPALLWTIKRSMRGRPAPAWAQRARAAALGATA